MAEDTNVIRFPKAPKFDSYDVMEDLNQAKGTYRVIHKPSGTFYECGVPATSDPFSTEMTAHRKHVLGVLREMVDDLEQRVQEDPREGA